jgi:stress-induced morphogen
MFGAHIVSPLFEGKARLARHRLVNTALKEQIRIIHAWTPKCYSREWIVEGRIGKCYWVRRDDQFDQGR